MILKTAERARPGRGRGFAAVARVLGPVRLMGATRIAALTVALLGLGATLTPSAALGQAILGEAFEAESGAPLEGAVVTAFDSSGEAVRSTLTNQDGRFRIQLRQPGIYTVRLDRIGFETVTSAPVEVQGTGTARIELQVPQLAIELEGITAEAEQKCTVRPGQGEATARLWDEARKALTATALTEAANVYRFEIFNYQRRLDLNSMRVEEEARQRSEKVTESPIQSLPAEDLAENGYVRRVAGDVWDYFAPDASVLLSDVFLDDHCFSVRLPESDDEEGLIGLAFEPVRGSRGSDIHGALWLDVESARLSHLEFRYTELPGQIRDDRLGGRVEFEGLPNGTWVVRKWWIRMPLLARGRTDYSSSVTGYVLAGIQEQGAEVGAIESLGGDRLRADQLGGSVEGVVHDSVSGAPLVGARVFVSGTRHSATTDENGSFLMEGVTPGDFTLAVVHPLLGRLTMPPLRQTISVVKDQTTEVMFGVPGPESLMADLCEDSPEERARWPGSAAALSGLVRDQATGGPLAGRRVRVVWSDFSVQGNRVGQEVSGYEVEAGNDGSFRICGLPPQTRLAVQLLPAGGDDRVLMETAVILQEEAWVGMEILMGEGDAQVLLGAGADAAPGVMVARTPEVEAAERLAETVRAREEPEANPLTDGAFSIEDVLRRVRGIRVRGQGGNLCVEPSRGGGDLDTVRGSCAWPMIILNGIQAPYPQDALIALSVEDIEEMEFVTPSQAGARYGTGSSNGVLIIRTYRGGR